MKTSKNKGFFFKCEGRIRISILVSCMILLGSLIIIVPQQATSDGGSIPFFSEFSVYEPGQKAIIAWDGEEEILILSVDLYSTGNNTILHMVPLPTLPTFESGNISAFTKINQLINLKGYYDGYYDGEGESEAESEDEDFKIEFYDQIGAHNLTVVNVNNSEKFTSWVTTFLNGKGVTNITFPDGTDDVVKHYIEQNINYFVFDVIEINKTERSVQPIIYNFKSEYLYYPMVISSIIDGVSEINVVTLTPIDLPVNTEDFSSIGFERNFGFRILHEELNDISSKIAELIPGDAYLSFHKNQFTLDSLKMDIKNEVLNNVNWMMTVYDDIENPLYYDCNSDDVEDIIFFSKPNRYYDWGGSQRSSTIDLTESSILAVDSIDGSIIWHYEMTEYYNNIQTVDVNSDGVLDVLGFFNNNNIFTIFALDITTGKELWVLQLEPANFYYNYYGYYYDNIPLKISDIDSDNQLEMVFYSSSRDLARLHVVNLDDGTESWNYTLSYSYEEEIMDFVILDINQDMEQEIVLRTEAKILSLNGKTGDLIWSKEFDENRYSLSYRYNLLESINDFDLDGELEIFLVSYDETIYIINGKDGSRVWNYYLDNDRNVIGTRSTGIHGWSSGSSYGFYDVDLDGILEIIYFWPYGIHAFNANNGTLLWENRAMVPDEMPVDFWFYYQYYDIDDYWNFEFCELDLDANPEIVYYYENIIYVINSENGNVLWSKLVNKTEDDSAISNLFIDDFDKDGAQEIIFNLENNIYSVYGEDGITAWQIIFNKELSIPHGPEDLDNDGSSEIIVYSDHKMHMLNCENGFQSWKFIAEEKGNLKFGGIDDLDHDGNSEIIFFDRIRMYALNPKTGNKIWQFTTGESIVEYYPYNRATGIDDIVIVSNEKIYSVDYRKIFLALNINPFSGTAGDLVSFVVYIGYSDIPITGVEIYPTDFGMNGIFTPVAELYPGVYEFNYIIPNTTHNFIDISIDVSHSDYFGIIENVQLTVLNESKKSEPSKPNITPDEELLTINTEAYPRSLGPGEYSTIFFKVSNRNINLTSNLSFHLFDNNVNGNFSTIEHYGNDYFTFIYTVPTGINVSSITLLILVTHNNFSDGLGVVQLNITPEHSGINNEIIYETKDIEQNKMSITLNPYPNKLSPGNITIVMVHITSENKPVNYVKIQPFDNGLGGTISKIIEYGGGHYSFIYMLPDNIPKDVTSVTLFIYISHDNFSSSIELTELSIIHKKDSNKNIDYEGIFLEIYAYPNQVYSDETTTIEVRIMNTSDIIDLSEISIELSDHGHGGSFLFVNKYDEGIYSYNYKLPKTSVNLIDITAVIYYKGEELCRGHINIELIPNQLNEDDESANKKSYGITPLGYITVILLIFTIGILIGVFGLIAYRSNYRKKSKDIKKPVDDSAIKPAEKQNIKNNSVKMIQNPINDAKK